MTLTVAGLNGWYGPAQVVFGVDLAVGAGEVVALVGRNGAGKSTTLRALMGLLPERSGRVALDGEDISRREPYEIARRGLGYVPEDRRIFTDLTVDENLAVGESAGRSSTQGWTRETLFGLFPALAAMRGRLGGRMSGGEQQMLSIARTLMGNPRLVLLDEPSEGLAPRVVGEVAAAIRVMKREGIGVLLCEQNLHFARAVADRALVIESGRIRFAGSMADIAAAPTLADLYLGF